MKTRKKGLGGKQHTANVQIDLGPPRYRTATISPGSNMRVGVQPEWVTPGGSNEDYDEQNSVASSVSRRSAPKRHVYGDGGQIELDSCVYWSTFSFFAVLNSIEPCYFGSRRPSPKSSQLLDSFGTLFDRKIQNPSPRK
jgi:hypothetical protein